jgi:hypothetical protein
VRPTSPANTIDLRITQLVDGKGVTHFSPGNLPSLNLHRDLRPDHLCKPFQLPPATPLRHEEFSSKFQQMNSRKIDFMLVLAFPWRWELGPPARCAVPEPNAKVALLATEIVQVCSGFSDKRK